MNPQRTCVLKGVFGLLGVLNPWLSGRVPGLRWKEAGLLEALHTLWGSMEAGENQAGTEQGILWDGVESGMRYLLWEYRRELTEPISPALTKCPSMLQMWKIIWPVWQSEPACDGSDTLCKMSPWKKQRLIKSPSSSQSLGTARPLREGGGKEVEALLRFGVHGGAPEIVDRQVG